MNGPTFAHPQTAARPAPAAAPPRPAAPVRPGPAPESGGFPVLTWLRLHWLMIVFCGTLLGSGLAYAAWNLLPSEFESYALLRVASAPFSVANQKDPNRSKADFATYMKTSRQLMKYEFVLNKALSQPQSGDPRDVTGPRISELATLRSQKDPIKYLDEKLLVESSDGSEVIRVALKGHSPGDIQKIVNAVQAAFMDEVIEKEIKDRAGYVLTVDKILNDLNDQLARKAGLKADPVPVGFGPAGNPLAAGPGAPNGLAPNAGPPDSVKRAMTNLLIQQVAALRQQTEQLPTLIQTQQARVDSLKRQIEALRQGPASKDVVEAVENDPEVRDLAAKAVYYRAKYNRDTATYQNPDAQVLQASRVAAEDAEKRLTEMKSKKTHEKELSKRQVKADDLFAKLDEAIRTLDESKEKLRADAQRLKNKEEELAKLPPDPVKDEAKKDEKKGPLVDPHVSDLMVTDDAFRGLSMLATQLRLDQESPKRVTVLQNASTPTQKDTKKQVLATVFAGLMGFVLVGFGAVGYEARAMKVCSLADLRATTATPVVGVIPWQPEVKLDADPVRRAEVAEAVDKLRGYVAQTWLARGATTVAVTSPLADEGKEYTAVGLAGSLAAAGYKTLLVDFDLRNPALHTLAGVPNEAGACELLRGEADFRQTIRTLPNGLHFLSAGAWSDAARQAAVGGRLESLLARLREPFDCVVIHAHSLLKAAESVEVARRCEVVLLCTLHRETRTPLLKRATERVATMEVPYSGVVYLGATPQEALC